MPPASAQTKEARTQALLAQHHNLAGPGSKVEWTLNKEFLPLLHILLHPSLQPLPVSLQLLRRASSRDWTHMAAAPHWQGRAQPLSSTEAARL